MYIPRSNILRINKIGPDVRGIGLKLSQPVMLSFTNLTGSEKYRVITSEDGIIWNDVEQSGKLYQADKNGEITFQTNHFSYFALLADVPVVTPPNCSMTFTPTTIQNGDTTVVRWSLTNSLTGILSPGNIVLGASG